VPKLWNQTIEAHRNQVREAILDTTAALVIEQGLRSVTMSHIAEQAGIGRATLYKYFPDVEAILIAWHQRHLAVHLGQLAAVRDAAGEPGARLAAVLQAYARIVHERARRQHGAAELTALVHRDKHVAHAERQLHDLIQGVIADAATAGHIRADIAPAELASYCVHALAAAAALPSHTAVRRLVTLTLTALEPPRPTNPVD
jgi:AcrR family transcriptional regulator